MAKTTKHLQKTGRTQRVWKKRHTKHHGEKFWENRVLVYILSSKVPVNASELQGEMGIAQPIAFKILNKLEEMECVRIFDKEDKLGPKRVWYAPTLWCLYYTCFMEFAIRPGNTAQRIEKTTTFQNFDEVFDRWITNPVFFQSVLGFVDQKDLDDASKSKEVKQALREHCELAIRSQEAYEEVKNDLPLPWRNMIGGAVIAERDSKYYMDTIKRISKYIIPIQKEMDGLEAKTREFVNQVKDEPQGN